MKILVINAGSSSLKYQLIDMKDESVLASGYCEKVTLDGSFNNHKVGDKKIHIDRQMSSHEDAVNLMLELLTTGDDKVIEDVNEIEAIGHRVVHGGEKFTKSALITSEVLSTIEACSDLAPLHNPANITGIKVCQKIFGDKVPNVAVFDTAFHQTMSPRAYMYALPYEYYEKYGVRRYGFHGTSHRYVSERLAEIMGKSLKDLRIISCHLGNGGSLCAINRGEVQDTTMGLTPLEGLMMGTRSGDIDPAIIKFIADKENLTISEIDNILNKKSGLLGVSKVSSDQRDILEAANNGDETAKLSIDMYDYRIIKYIGAYIAAMNGTDAIIFTAGIGENAADRREAILESLTYFGINLDPAKNLIRKEEVEISTPDSKIRVFVIPTNEELMIARDTETVCNGLN